MYNINHADDKLEPNIDVINVYTLAKLETFLSKHMQKILRKLESINNDIS